MEAQDILISTDDAARIYLHVAPQTIREWRMDGKGPRYVRVGRKIFYRLTDIREWIDSQASQSTRESAQAAG